MRTDSARGIDGISPQELKMMPPLAISHLMHIMHSYADGFPIWLMWTKTCPVPKKAGVISAAQVRPISVMALLYRLWSKVQCRHVLLTILSQLPHSITGFLPGRGPYDAVYEMQWMLEQAHEYGPAQSGISLDLLKCFNTIHRPAARTTLQTLGVPPALLRQYFQSLHRVTRSWCLQDAMSPPKATTRGCPEGDPLSVLTMLSIATAWTSQVQHHTPTARLGAYADNWGWMLTQPSQHAEVIQNTQLIVKAYTMHIDWTKSWVWLTDPTQLPQLKRALLTQLGQVCITHVLTAMDLGGQHTYHGPPKLGKVQNRFNEASVRLKRLQSMPHDLTTKVLMVKMGIYSQAFYASAILPVGRKHTDQMRTQVADAILGPSVSRNSAVALQCMPKLEDPELVLIWNAISMAHRYLSRCAPAQADLFLRTVAQHDGISYKCKGPAGCLKFYLCRLGWEIDTQGIITVAAFRSFHLTSTSKQMWRRLMQETWQEDLLLQHANKKAYRGLPPINKADTTAVLQKFPASDQKAILNEISAAFQCNTQQAKWDPQTDPHCKYCGQLDTKFHRVHQCTFTADLRQDIHDTIQWMETEGVEWHELPVIHTHHDHAWLQTYHTHQLTPDVPEAMYNALQQIDLQGAVLNFYTDGSCQHPASINCRYSSFSVIIDVSTNDDERIAAARHFANGGPMPPCLHTLCVGRTPGEQRIHRAELFAIVWICERFHNVAIHTDSTVALAAIRACKQERACFQHMEDLDLILRLQQVIHLGNKTFLKVQAHAEHARDVTWMTLFHRLGNKCANDAAIVANKILQPDAVTDFESMHTDLETHRQHLQKLFSFHLQVIKRHATQKIHEATLVSHEGEFSGPTSDEVFQQFLDYSVIHVWTPSAQQMNEFRACAWGFTIATNVLEWARLIKWPTDEGQHPLQEDGVTWIELVLSFMFTQKILLPVKRQGPGNQEHLIAFSSVAAMEAYSVRLAELANPFAILTKQVTDLCDQAFLPSIERGLVRSLYKLGSNIFSSGYKWRAQYPAQDKVLTCLKPYLQKYKGPAYTALPDLDITPNSHLFERINRELQGTWQQRSTEVHRAMKRIRQWRRDPQPRLFFA